MAARARVASAPWRTAFVLGALGDLVGHRHERARTLDDGGVETNGVGPGQTSFVVLHAIAYPPGGDNTTTVLLGATSGSVAVFRAGDPAHVALCAGDGSSAGGRPSAAFSPAHAIEGR